MRKIGLQRGGILGGAADSSQPADSSPLIYIYSAPNMFAMDDHGDEIQLLRVGTDSRLSDPETISTVAGSR